VVEHPTQWEVCGYNEIQNPRKRKGIIDFDRLMDLLGFENNDDFKGIPKSSVMKPNNSSFVPTRSAIIAFIN